MPMRIIDSSGTHRCPGRREQQNEPDYGGARVSDDDSHRQGQHLPVEIQIQVHASGRRKQKSSKAHTPSVGSPTVKYA